MVDWSNFVVRIDGALAWAEYDERTTTPTGSAALLARQQRTLVKRDGEWRILSAGSFVGSSYGASPAAIETRLDGVGADLTSAKMHKDAIEVLELNARLFPRSSSAHQRLGAAYAAAGDTKLATRSYSRSLRTTRRSRPRWLGSEGSRYPDARERSSPPVKSLGPAPRAFADGISAGTVAFASQGTKCAGVLYQP